MGKSRNSRRAKGHKARKGRVSMERARQRLQQRRAERAEEEQEYRADAELVALARFVWRAMGSCWRETHGRCEPDCVQTLVCAEIAEQLWRDGGPDADWAAFDACAVYDELADHCPQFLDEPVYMSLFLLIDWLGAEGLLSPAREQALLAELETREPPRISGMRLALAAQFDGPSPGGRWPLEVTPAPGELN